MDPRSNGHDVEFIAGYDALPSAGEDEMEIIGRPPRWNCRLLAFAVSAVVLLALGAMLTGLDSPDPPPQTLGVPVARVSPRGVREGVSAKSRSPFRGVASDAFSWSNEMLQWQRSAFHFQPEKNWMNDPNGPLFFNGWYHLFYQYNPDSAVWGNITWGHAVSRDLIHWLHLPLAMLPDQWYDANGVWTGSATILPDGRLLMLYTGSTNASVQVQNLAYPADQSDPLLLNWVKSPSNPVLVPPPGIGDLDFRDPTTAWFVPSRSAWQVAIGSKDDSKDHTGITLIYETKDFLKYDLLPGVLHAVPKTGMWECVDFYPVSIEGDIGLDTSRNGPGVKHVLKASMDDDRHDYYAIGTFDVDTGKWKPDNPELDVGVGLRYDYGVFYASKTFYDQEKRRRVLLGWIGESDSEGSDIAKGWASLQGIPRTARLDDKTGSNLVQWPVEEVESLRGKGKHFANITLAGGSVVPLYVKEATQLDITIDFEIEKEALEGGVLEAEEEFTCGTSEGSARRGALGPFGVLVLASEDLSERTAVYFYVAKKKGGELSTFICHDELRSSRANDLIEGVFGSSVPVLDGEKLSLRILVDHSIVETFAQGGRTCITSRVYPTKAIYDATRLFLFNNATASTVTATSVEVWEMQSASIRPYPGL